MFSFRPNPYPNFALQIIKSEISSDNLSSYFVGSGGDLKINKFLSEQNKSEELVKLIGFQFVNLTFHS